MIEAVLAEVAAGERLSPERMREATLAILSGEESDVVVAGLLSALRTRGETIDELAGAAEALRSRAVEVPRAPLGAVDTCGTGGDGANTFNISTVAALVVAGSGVPVAKHGNRAASSRCGSAEVLEALGVRLDVPPAHMAGAVERVGIGFLYARACHPGMAVVAPVRSALKIPTIFNRLGPLLNPMHVRRQLLGVGRAEHMADALEVLVRLGAESAWIVHGDDGLDEVTTTTSTRVLAYHRGETRELVLEAGAHVPVAASADLAGGDAEHNATIARRILDGQPGAPRDIVLLNAAAALCAAEAVDDVDEGLALAAKSIDSGRARDLLALWVEDTRSAA